MYHVKKTFRIDNDVGSHIDLHINDNGTFNLYVKGFGGEKSFSIPTKYPSDVRESVVKGKSEETAETFPEWVERIFSSKDIRSYSNTFGGINVIVDCLFRNRASITVRIPDPKIDFKGRFVDYHEVISSNFLRLTITGKDSEIRNFSSWIASLNLYMTPSIRNGVEDQLRKERIL